MSCRYLHAATMLVLLASCGSSKTAGTSAPPEEPQPCGDGVRIGEEQCDGQDLAGESCTSAGYDGGTLACAADCTFAVSGCTGVPPECGDNLGEGFESCDGDDLRGATCASVGYDGGTLGCTIECSFDVAGCTGTPPVCGDGNAEGLEECDGLDLRQLDCAALGFAGGVLRCDDSCQFVTGECASSDDLPVCGDGVAEGLEACDGNDTNGLRCLDLGYDSGLLACNESCLFDTSACAGTSALCGDGVVGGLEECDRAELEGATCADLGYVGGELACDSSCTYDPSGCTMPSCGNSIQEPGEQCDGTDLPLTTCQELLLGAGNLTCSSNCTYDVSSCAPPVCGDGVVNQSSEDCDGGDFAGESCRTLTFRGGQLLCNDDCTIDTFFCWGTTAACGDGELALSEDCEGADLGGETCESLSYSGGELACVDCVFDTSGCTGDGPVCPNNVAEGDELCDGSDLRGMTCEDFGFTGGTLVCNVQCVFSFVGCTFDAVCGNDTAERLEVCDGNDLRGETCATQNFGSGTLACAITCDAYDYSGCTNPPVCGNDTIEGEEVCDGADLGMFDSCLLFGYSDGGTIACLSTCAAYDLSACTGAPARCDGIRAQGMEQCDGDDLRHATCETLGYASGTLSCHENCSYDVSACVP